MKTTSKVVLVAIILSSGVIAIYQLMSSPITFASAESRTLGRAIVYNEVTWQWKKSKDIWIMRQSHNGPKLHKGKWDKLVITVENQKTRFYQLESGKNEFTGTEKEVPFKVSCFMCHSNGPRAIRPMELESLKENIQVKLLNLRIKLYGKLENLNNTQNQVGDVPFRHTGKISNTPLNLSACMKCHQDQGFFSRGFLTRQNGVTIDFMVKNQHMPPIGDLKPEEQRYLKDFRDGF